MRAGTTVATYDEINSQMQFALAANIENLQKKGESLLQLTNGELVSEKAGIFLYEFTVNSPQSIDEDSDVEVRVGSTNTFGTVVAIQENGRIRVALEENLGTKVPEATLISTSYQLLKKLKEHLELLRTGAATHTDLAEKLFGINEFSVSEDSDYEFPIHKDRLNDFQESAVRLAVGSEVSFIWGPPGTGKTFTISRLVEAMLHTNKTVLLISHTNAATDGALKSVVEHLKNTEDYKDGRLIRVGKIYDPELMDKNVTLEKIAENKSKEALKEVEIMRERLSVIKELLARSESAKESLYKHEELESNYHNLNGYIKKLKNEGIRLAEEVNQNQREIKQINKRLEEYQSLGRIKKLLSGINEGKIVEERRLLREKTVKKSSKISELRTEYKNSIEEYRKTEKLLEKSKLALKNSGFLEDAEVKEIESEKEDLENSINKIIAELNLIEENLIGNAKLIASTLTKSYQTKTIIQRKYDCVIVDESSMAPLPALLSAAGLATERVVMVGDCYQLSPIVKFNESPRPTPKEAEQIKFIDYWLKQNIYDYLSITDSIEKGKIPKFLRQLRPQKRMHPDISALVNHLIYEKRNKNFGLINMVGTEDIGEKLINKGPLENSHLGIYDTSILGSVPARSDSNSTYNLPHAMICLELVNQAVANGYQDIGVISAYRAQVELIKRLVEDVLSPADALKVKVDTVHKFQGGEKELIIFDVTTPKRGSMYDRDDKEAERLINVAFSRAQAKCIIVCDVASIEKSNSQTSLILEAINFCRANKHPIINANVLVPKEVVAANIDKIFAVDIKPGVNIDKAITIFKDESFYDGFKRDIAHASKELIIMSPFVTTFRSEKLKPLFSNFLLKGGKIFILTRPPESQDINMRAMAVKELKEFEDMGIFVLPMAKITKTHEKVAVFDRKVLYHGSLNILSFRDSGESMFRITSEAGNFPERYLKLTGISKNIGSNIGESRLKHCEVCTATGAWYWTDRSFYGPWVHCLYGMHSVGKPPNERKTIEARRKERSDVREQIKLNKEGIPLCPIHNLETIFKEGRPPFSDYYECPDVKKCDYRLNINKLNRFKSKSTQAKLKI